MSESRKVEFTGAFGDRLVGRLHEPASEPAAYALFAHCFTCSKDLKAAVRISRALARHGIATLRFDFTGLGESAGDFADTSFSSNVDDLVVAADYLRERHAAPRILIGHSLGGAAVLRAAHRVDEVRAVATIGAPFDPEHVRHLIESQAPDLAERGECEVTLAGRTFRVRKQFLDDLEAQESRTTIGELGRALAIFHSPQDEIVGIDNARLIYEAARHPKSFISLDGADHLLRRADDAEYAASVLAAWADRYLPAPADEPQRVEEGLGTEEPGVAVVESGLRPYAQRVRVSGHALRADEPESVGGGNTGPTPYDLLLAALGACTNMTLRMYADRKKWPLEGVVSTLRHRKIHAEDCEACETKAGKLDDVEVRIALAGDLDQDQRARLLEIAHRCPIHRTLTSEVRVRAGLGDEGEEDT